MQKSQGKIDYQMYYVDSENDKITLSEEEDLGEAHRYARTKKLKELEVIAIRTERRIAEL